MIKLSHMVIGLMVASCLLVTIATSSIFFSYNNRLERNEVLLQGQSTLNRFRQEIDYLIVSVEEKQHWVSSVFAEYTTVEEWLSQLENNLISAFVDSQSVHYELLFVTNPGKERVLNYSTLTLGDPQLLDYIATQSEFINGFARVNWDFGEMGQHEFIVARRRIRNKINTEDYWLYAAVRLTGVSGYLEATRAILEAPFLIITDTRLDTLIASTSPISTYELSDTESGLSTGKINGEETLLVAEDMGLHGVFSNARVVIPAPESMVAHLSSNLKTAYYALLAFLIIYVTVAFFIVRSMVSKSMAQVLKATNQLVEGGVRDMDPEIEQTRIHEFAKLLGNFSVLASRLRLSAEKHKAAEDIAVAQTHLLSRNKEELETQNRELSRLNEQMEQFVYSTSHDLKAPLTTICGLSQIATFDLADGNLEEVQTNIDKIRTLSQSLSNMIEDLLEVVKLDHTEIEKTTVNVRELVQTSWEQQPSGPHGAVSLHLDIAHEDPIETSDTYLKGILDNLLGNAVKYSSPERVDRFARVKTRITDGTFELTISDNGVGIPEEFHDRVFKMFQKFDRQGLAGTGLGLSIVRKYAEKLGGDITFKSLDQGIEFYVRWPL